MSDEQRKQRLQILYQAVYEWEKKNPHLSSRRLNLGYPMLGEFLKLNFDINLRYELLKMRAGKLVNSCLKAVGL